MRKDNKINVILEPIIIVKELDYYYYASKFLQDEINARCPKGYKYAGTVASELKKGKDNKVSGYVIVAYEKIK